MKNRSQKVLLLLIILLLVGCGFFIFQWNKEKTQADRLNSLKEQMIFTNFTYFTKELNAIVTTLTQYDEEFSERERDLFRQSLDKDRGALNETGIHFTFLLNSTTLGDALLYESYIWKIEEMLGEIANGKIANESDIRAIGKVIEKHNERLAEIFYVEQVGVEGINTKEELLNVMEILDRMNEEIGEVLEE